MTSANSVLVGPEHEHFLPFSILLTLPQWPQLSWAQLTLLILGVVLVMIGDSGRVSESWAQSQRAGQ